MGGQRHERDPQLLYWKTVPCGILLKKKKGILPAPEDLATWVENATLGSGA